MGLWTGFERGNNSQAINTPCFSLQETADGPGRVLTLSGELDLAAVAQLEDAVLRACADRPAQLEIDLDSVEFIDSSGIAALVAAHESCVRHGVALRLVPSAHPGLQRVLEITGVQEVLSLFSAQARRRSEDLRESSEALRAQSEQLGRKLTDIERRRPQRK